MNANSLMNTVYMTALCATMGFAGACSTSSGNSVPEEPVCPNGFEECEGRCVTLSADFSHCGACSTPCSSSQEACIEGACLPLCGVASAETVERLVELLAGTGMDEIEGAEKYVSVTGQVDLLPGEAGEGAMFMTAGGDLPGVTLGDETQFGFDMENSGYCCGYKPGFEYPVTAFRSAIFQDAEFTFEKEHYEALEGVCTPSDPALSCISVSYSSSLDCIYPSACCCSQEPILWDIFTLRPVPEVCTAETTCYGLAGFHPSVCYDNARQYVLGQTEYVHADCIDETGHVKVDDACTCEVGWDAITPTPGTCSDSGRCMIEGGSGNYIPMECSIVH
jgi:hypothetical protein